MKHIFQSILVLLFIILLSNNKAFSQKVYVQENGKKYHLKNCNVAGNGKKGLSINDAKKAGYSACNVCRPNDGNSSKSKTKKKEKPITPATKPQSSISDFRHE